MVEIHDWATIRFTPENRDLENEEVLQKTAVELVQTYRQQNGWLRNPWTDIRWVNGEAHLWADAFTNHSEAIHEEVLDLFLYITQIAPGSYGLLYLYDDEDPTHGNESRVYVLARGILTEHADPFLTPFVPVVEEAPSEN